MCEVVAILAAYAWAVAVGAGVSWLVSESLHFFVRRSYGREFDQQDATRLPWVPLLLGLVERSIVVSLMLWLPSDALEFVAAWMLIKAAGGWVGANNTHYPEQRRVLYMVALMGSVVSVGWAVAVAMIFGIHELQSVSQP